MKTWEEAIEGRAYKVDPTYREGYRCGWLDASIGHLSVLAQTSVWGNYASGYQDGQLSYRAYNPVTQDGEITCLKNLFL